jgi:hypothetical protein
VAIERHSLNEERNIGREWQVAEMEAWKGNFIAHLTVSRPPQVWLLAL